MTEQSATGESRRRSVIIFAAMTGFAVFCVLAAFNGRPEWLAMLFGAVAVASLPRLIVRFGLLHRSRHLFERLLVFVLFFALIGAATYLGLRLAVLLYSLVS